MTIHWKAVEQYFTVVLFAFFNFPQFVILNNLSFLDLVLSGVKGLILHRYLLVNRSRSRVGCQFAPAHHFECCSDRSCLSFKGRKAPKSWQGGLQMTYRIGPGFVKPNFTIRMEVYNKLETKTIYNVIGRIRGNEQPDRYVLMGNHRDAWVFGAADAVSGTSILMEISRGLGKLLRAGWRPRRTIMLCSWDAEELLVVGSTEWVEENAKVLQDRAVAYLNMDVAVNGNFSFNVDATPLLQDFAVSLTKQVCDPTVSHTCRSMFDVMLERDVTKHTNSSPVCDNLSFGSDYAAFYHFTGVSSADWSYIFGGIPGVRRSYPVYHSAHDSFSWVKSFVDPEFQIHLAVARYAGTFLLQLAESKRLPFNTSAYGQLLRLKSAPLVNDRRFKANNISMAAYSRAVKHFVKTARMFQDRAEEEKADELRTMNDQMMQLERAFIQTIVTNDPKQLRHVIYAPDVSNLYDGLYFPRLQHATATAERTGNWELVKKEVSLLTYSINSATKVLEPI